MPLTSALRPIVQPSLRARSHTFIQHRHAQTAFKAELEDDNHGSASHSHHHRVQSHSHPIKGKQRADPFAQQYRFPVNGRDGGAPDPFEVLGVDKSASDKEVKQHCK